MRHLQAALLLLLWAVKEFCRKDDQTVKNLISFVEYFILWLWYPAHFYMSAGEQVTIDFICSFSSPVQRGAAFSRKTAPKPNEIIYSNKETPCFILRDWNREEKTPEPTGEPPKANAGLQRWTENDRQLGLFCSFLSCFDLIFILLILLNQNYSD